MSLRGSLVSLHLSMCLVSYILLLQPVCTAELHRLPESTIALLEAHGAQRSKNLSANRLTTANAKQRTYRSKFCIIAMTLLLSACATAALLWKFGMLEPIGIGGAGGDQNTEKGNVESLAPTTLPPSAKPIPELLNRIPLPATPISPTSSPSRLIKTLPPTSASESPTKSILPTGTTTFSPTTIMPTANPTAATAHAAYQTDLFQLLEASSFDYGAALRVNGSPQQQAFVWLLQNANLDSYTSSKKVQRFALATLYYATNGDAWAENLWWLSDEDECTWFNKQVVTGYEACGATNRNDTRRVLTSLDLSFNSLRGSIPPELGLLSGLLRVDFDGGPSGYLSGRIPSEMGLISQIESFSARGNELTGSLPTELGSWGQVRGIDLSFNKLSGRLPSAFGSMTWLTELTLEMNDLSGTLPAAGLRGLANLFKLSLGGNNLIGTLPTEIGYLTKLKYLYLELNQFSSLPTDIGRLENLNVLSFFENKIEGIIPSEIGGLTKLASLLLRSNGFFGKIPSEIGLMVNLQSE